MKYEIISKYRSELMGLAMLAVLLFHAFDITIGIPLLDFLRNYLYIGVDLFVFLSGLGISMSLSRREVEFVDYMKKRCARILPSYYLVVIPWTIFAVYTKMGHWSSLIWNTTLLAYWVKPGGTFNWYVTGIMVLYIIAPFWHKKLTKYRFPALTTFVGVALTLLVTWLLMWEGFWNWIDIIYRVPIFLVGMLIGRYITEGKRLGAKEIIASVVSLAAGALVFLGAVNGVGRLVPCFAYILLIFPLSLICSALFELLPLGWLRAGLREIGNASLEIYLLNASIFIETELLRKIINLGGTSHRLYYLVIFIINIAMGIGLSKLINVIRRRVTIKLAQRAE